MKARTFPTVNRSILLLICVVLQLNFITSILHDGDHALNILARGAPITIFYAHPFSFAGYALPIPTQSSEWFHVMGTVESLMVSLLIFVLLWKRYSVANLPLVVLFPWITIISGVGVISIPAQTGDYYIIIQLTGLPGSIFYVPGTLLVLLGIFFFVLLLPLLGLAPGDARPLFAVAADLLLWSILSMPVAYLFVPGSPIDVQYQRGGNYTDGEQRSHHHRDHGGADFRIFVGLYRWIDPRLPAWHTPRPST